ncbi:MAG TPA: tRNA pseudouridine(55) synthase TruB, partial [Tepidisphaeraceae bacterium]|nr:tRNA pseudouridine(55) synthase TruB [Tepidisphaeraceae bacterium]
MNPVHGILNLDKPAGLSSAKAVDRVKRLLPRGTKVGHAGTLDPFATGVLLVLIGKATKSCEKLMDLPKQYETTVKLGATTATDDPESPEAPTPRAAEPSRQAIESALERMTGTVMQRPPAYSAMKIDGRRAYELARKGAIVEIAARPVRIDSIKILDWQWPLLRLLIDCGRGTYIRSIARDLGEALNTGGYLTQLRRTRVGDFT